MSRCRSCGQFITWTTTERGKKMPLDADPYSGGDPSSLFVIRSGVAVAVPPDAFPGEPVFQSHLKTCTQPNRRVPG